MDEKCFVQVLCLYLECVDQVFQLGYLGVQFVVGLFGLVGVFCGVFVGLVDFDDVLVDIVGYGGLLFGGGGDLLVLVDDYVYCVEDIFQCLLYLC